MALSTATAFDIVCRLDLDDTLDEFPQNKKQKIVTGLLLEKHHKQDFAVPLTRRTRGNEFRGFFQTEVLVWWMVNFLLDGL